MAVEGFADKVFELIHKTMDIYDKEKKANDLAKKKLLELHTLKKLIYDFADAKRRERPLTDEELIEKMKPEDVAKTLVSLVYVGKLFDANSPQLDSTQIDESDTVSKFAALVTTPIFRGVSHAGSLSTNVEYIKNFVEAKDIRVPGCNFTYANVKRSMYQMLALTHPTADHKRNMLDDLTNRQNRRLLDSRDFKHVIKQRIKQLQKDMTGKNSDDLKALEVQLKVIVELKEKVDQMANQEPKEDGCSILVPRGPLEEIVTLFSFDKGQSSALDYRIYERGGCFTCMIEEGHPTGTKAFDSIVNLAALCTKQFRAKLSREDALQVCFDHARSLLTATEDSIPGSDTTYAQVGTHLLNITESEYFRRSS